MSGPNFTNLSDPIFHFAELRPEALALWEGGETVSYGRLAEQVRKTAVHLRALGVRSGELVGLAMPTTIAHVVLVFALFRIGAIPVDVPWRRPAAFDPFAQFGVQRVVAPPDQEVVARTVHRLDETWRAEVEAADGDYRHPDPSDNSLTFSFSSGSTGQPKGIVTTQREWWERYRSARALLPDVLSPERPANLLVLGEISFSGFFFMLYCQLSIGGPAILIGVVESTKEALAAIRQWDDSAFVATPLMARDMLDNATGEGLLLPKVRALMIGSAPLYDDEKLAICAKLTPNVYELYGNAATGFISALTPDEIASHSASVGRVAPGMAVEIIDGRGRHAPPGAIGFIRCRGSGLSQRVLNAEPPSANGPEGLRNGSYFTGDIGALDASGYLYLKGRIADVFKRGGTSVFPVEIEAALASHANVAEAAVVGVPAQGDDLEIVGVVTPRGAADLNAVAEHCRKLLSNDKWPNRLFWVEALPKTATGKVDKPALRALLASKLGRAGAGGGGT